MDELIKDLQARYPKMRRGQLIAKAVATYLRENDNKETSAESEVFNIAYYLLEEFNYHTESQALLEA